MDCVESFLALAETRHYGRAAATLHITSAALTKRIQRLERQLQARLLERDQGGVLALTRAGERLVAAAPPLLLQERAVRSAVQGTTVTVTLGLAGDGVTCAVTGQRLMDVRRLLNLEYPGVLLVGRYTPLPLQVVWLLEGRVDVQLTAAAVRHRGVHSTPIGAVHRMAIVPADSELGQAQQVLVENLLDLPLLYDPRLPDELMLPFWLGDVASRSWVRRVAVSAAGGRDVLDQVRRSAGVAVLVEPRSREAPPGLHLLPVSAAPPVVLHAARRTADRRPHVLSLVDALHAVPVA